MFADFNDALELIKPLNMSVAGIPAQAHQRMIDVLQEIEQFSCGTEALAKVLSTGRGVWVAGVLDEDGDSGSLHSREQPGEKNPVALQILSPVVARRISADVLGVDDDVGNAQTGAGFDGADRRLEKDGELFTGTVQIPPRRMGLAEMQTVGLGGFAYRRDCRLPAVIEERGTGEYGREQVEIKIAESGSHE